MTFITTHVTYYNITNGRDWNGDNDSDIAWPLVGKYFKNITVGIANNALWSLIMPYPGFEVKGETFCPT